MFKKLLSLSVIVCFFLTTLTPYQAHAGTILNLPAPGTMVNLSPAYQPVIIKGLTVHKDNPFLFDFIVDTGNSGIAGDELKKQGDRMVKYFFACLTIPEKDLWVNLSPYEKDRMIPQALGQTALGRDLLAQDYILKQLTASLIYPEKDLGKAFWDRVYAKARQMYGTTQIPVNTFNKVWIIADKASVYEHGQTAFVVSGYLKVMLEEDYLALRRHSRRPVIPKNTVILSEAKDLNKLKDSSVEFTPESFNRGPQNGTHALASQIVRAIILPEIEKEVNTAKNFATLRQIFNSLILATWYKKNLKEALLNQVYADKSKVKGINLSDPTIKQQIYDQYLKAYKKGVFNYIKEDSQPNSQTIPRKYFSGGFVSNLAMTVDNNPADAAQVPGPIGKFLDFTVAANPAITPAQVFPDTARRDSAMQISPASALDILIQAIEAKAKKATLSSIHSRMMEITVRGSVRGILNELVRRTKDRSLAFQPLEFTFTIIGEKINGDIIFMIVNVRDVRNPSEVIGWLKSEKAILEPDVNAERPTGRANLVATPSVDLKVSGEPEIGITEKNLHPAAELPARHVYTKQMVNEAWNTTKMGQTSLGPNRQTIQLLAAGHIVGHYSEFDTEVVTKAKRLISIYYRQGQITNLPSVRAADIIIANKEMFEKIKVSRAADALRSAWSDGLVFKWQIAPVLLEHPIFQDLHSQAERYLIDYYRNYFYLDGYLTILKEYQRQRIKQILEPEAGRIIASLEQEFLRISRKEFEPTSTYVNFLYRYLDLIFTLWEENIPGLNGTKARALNVWDKMVISDSLSHRFYAAILWDKYQKILDPAMRSTQSPSEKPTNAAMLAATQEKGIINRVTLFWLQEHGVTNINPDDPKRVFLKRFLSGQEHPQATLAFLIPFFDIPQEVMRISLTAAWISAKYDLYDNARKGVEYSLSNNKDAKEKGTQMVEQGTVGRRLDESISLILEETQRVYKEMWPDAAMSTEEVIAELKELDHYSSLFFDEHIANVVRDFLNDKINEETAVKQIGYPDKSFIEDLLNLARSWRDGTPYINPKFSLISGNKKEPDTAMLVSQRSRFKILLLAPDHEIREHYTGILKAAGYRVENAFDFTQAKDVLSLKKIDFLIVKATVIDNKKDLESIDDMAKKLPNVSIALISFIGINELRIRYKELYDMTNPGNFVAVFKPNADKEQIILSVDSHLMPTDAAMGSAGGSRPERRGDVDEFIRILYTSQDEIIRGFIKTSLIVNATPTSYQKLIKQRDSGIREDLRQELDKIIDGIKGEHPDWAMTQPVENTKNGGIDLNTAGMNWGISKDGRGVEMNVDPAMVERIKREGIDSLSPVIFQITPVANIWSLVGLQAPAR